jgi:hypothetical protein
MHPQLNMTFYGKANAQIAFCMLTAWFNGPNVALQVLGNGVTINAALACCMAASIVVAVS